jgi:hypothetical protein
MEIAELKRVALKHVEYAVKQIQQSGGDFPMHFFEHMRDGGVRVFLFEGAVTNDRAMKRKFGNRIRQDVATGECVATVLLSDTFFATDMKLEGEKIRAAFGWNIEESAAAGLCTKHEGIVATAEMRGYHCVIRQEYKRDGGSITPVGELFTQDSTEWEVGQANLSGFFNTPAANAARN